MGFAVFLLLNAILYVRPGDLIPWVEPLHPYEVVILTCVLLGFPQLIAQLSPQSLRQSPITACVLGLFAVTVVTEVIRLRLEAALEAAEELAKMGIYLLLLVGFVDSPGKMRWMLRSLLACGVLILALAVVNYHNIATIPGIHVTIEGVTRDGEQFEERRLGTTTILGDPNDCALFIDHCLLITVFLALDGGGPPALRALWVAPMLFCGYALTLTQSRGGLASLMAGLGAYCVGRFGRKAVFVAAPFLPVLLALFGGRQGNIDVTSGTGQTRVQLWMEYLGFFRDNALLGLGWKQGVEAVTYVAHNSFLQGYGEQGFAAGTLFVGAFYVAFRSFGRLMTRPNQRGPDTEASRLRPCLFGIVVSQIMGMMALSRNYALPTYTVLGLVAAYARFARIDPPLPTGGRLVKHLLAASVLFLIYIWFVIRLTVRYS